MRPFGKYRLVEPIAAGGMAEVWRAEAPGAEGFVKEVALKVIRGGHDADEAFVRMFVQEARLASRLAHANIVQVFDFDHVDGRYYLAMELVRGRTLRDAVERCRELGIRFGLARAVHVCAEVARALAYAHGLEDGGAPAGLVHRDVSPHNVLLSFEGDVKLTDFGIARAVGSSEVTAPGTVKGKLAYMAPEQARGDAVDGRADVFALGVVLWELCAGRRLFAREGDAATLAALCGDEPVSPPSAWNEGVPPELDAIALAALARDPAARTASAEALGSALVALRLRLAARPEDLDVRALLRRLWPEGGGPPARPREHTSARTVPPPRAEEPPTRTAVAGRRRGRAIPFALALAVLVAVAALGAATAHAARRAPPARTSAPPALVPPPAPGAGRSSPDALLAVATGRPPQGTSTPAPERPGDATPPQRAPDPADPASRSTPAPSRERLPAGRRRAAVSPAAGQVVVHATPWAYVTIDGVEAGETPLERPVPARRHRLHAHHPTLGDDEAVVTVAPGQRVVWKPTLSR